MAGSIIIRGHLRASEAQWSDPGGGGEPEAAPRLTPLREMQLLAAYRTGDAGALAELLSDYQRRVYAVCRRMTRDRDEAADLTQESLLKVMDGLDSYRGRSAFSTWVIRVTMNCCLSHLRRERVRRHGSLDEPTGPGGEPRGLGLTDPRELSGPRRVERAEVKPALVRALDGLEPDMKAVLVLRDRSRSPARHGQVEALPRPRRASDRGRGGIDRS